MEVSSGKYDDAEEISRVSMSESDGESNITPHPRKKRNATRKEQRKTLTQIPALQESFLSPSASKADVFDQNVSREKLQAVPRSVLRFYFW